MKNNSFYREFVESDINDMDINDIFGLRADLRQSVLDITKSSDAHMYTVLSPSGEILAVVGMTFIYSSVAEVWTVSSKKVSTCSSHYMKTVKRMLDYYFEELAIERVQIMIRKDFPWSVRFGKFLGCKLEGVLSKYGEENMDYYMFAKVRA